MAVRKPIPPPQIVKPPRDAEGVAYTSMAGTDRKFFACTPYRATLSREGCGARWREAQAAQGQAIDRFALCRGCPVGAAHAGEDFVRYSWLFGTLVCPRCRKGGARMIGNRFCISCTNRNYELAKGKNARGNAPRILLSRPAVAREVNAIVDARATIIGLPAVVDLQELVIQTLRTRKGVIGFGFRGVNKLRQGRLF